MDVYGKIVKISHDWFVWTLEASTPIEGGRASSIEDAYVAVYEAFDVSFSYSDFDEYEPVLVKVRYVDTTNTTI